MVTTSRSRAAGDAAVERLWAEMTALRGVVENGATEHAQRLDALAAQQATGAAAAAASVQAGARLDGQLRRVEARLREAGEDARRRAGEVRRAPQRRGQRVRTEAAPTSQ
eukprot:COSAG01_NODE_5381_length_4295_cov_4.857245_1_plen_109_part_10